MNIIAIEVQKPGCEWRRIFKFPLPGKYREIMTFNAFTVQYNYDKHTQRLYNCRHEDEFLDSEKVTANSFTKLGLTRDIPDIIEVESFLKFLDTIGYNRKTKKFVASNINQNAISHVDLQHNISLRFHKEVSHNDSYEKVSAFIDSLVVFPKRDRSYIETTCGLAYKKHTQTHLACYLYTIRCQDAYPTLKVPTCTNSAEACLEVAGLSLIAMMGTALLDGHATNLSKATRIRLINHWLGIVLSKFQHQHIKHILVGVRESLQIHKEVFKRQYQLHNTIIKHFETVLANPAIPPTPQLP